MSLPVSLDERQIAMVERAATRLPDWGLECSFRTRVDARLKLRGIPNPGDELLARVIDNALRSLPR